MLRILRSFALVLAVSAPCVAGADTSAQVPPSLRSAIEKTMYRIEPAKDARVPDENRAANPAQSLNTSFTSSGVRITSGAVSGESWQWAMDLESWGYRGKSLPAAPANLSVSGNRIEYRRGPLTEWYVNNRTGIEQGFTITAPPAGTRPPREMLELALAVRGDLAPRLMDSGLAIQLVSPDGAPVLRYSDLHALDAVGRSLPARLTVSSRRIRLLVDDTAATYPITIDPVIWSEQARLTVADVASGDRFGTSVALSGDTALVGSPFRSTSGGLAAGEAYVFVRDGDAWSLQQALIPDDGARNDLFGNAVAVAGDTAVIGAPGRNSFTGQAYVYVRSGSTWSLQQKLVDPGGVFNDELGISVALSGETVLAGASRPAVGGGVVAGKAHIFVRSGDTWSLQQTLTASDGGPGDQFGFSVGLSGDTALVGVPRYNQFFPTSLEKSGLAYVFVRSGVTWSRQQTLTDAGATRFGIFGYSVSLSGDTALVAAPGRASVAVFVRNEGAWSLQQSLTASDGQPGDEFGISVAVNGDTALVGAPTHSPTPGFDAGQAYAFTRSGSTWSLPRALTASDGVRHSQFGFAVALSGDSALLSAPFHTNTSGIAVGGQAYVFVSSGTVDDFSIALSPASGTVQAGSTTTFTVSSEVTRGSAETIALSVSGLPAGVTGSFDPTSIAAGESSTLTLTASMTAAGATQTFTVTGTTASFVHTANASVTVVPNDFSLAVSPVSQSLGAGGSTTYSVNTTITSGVAETVALSVSGLPAGVTGSFDPTSIAAGASSTLTLTASIGAAGATQTFTVTGAGAPSTHTASASVTVVPVPNDFSLSVNPASRSVAAGSSTTYGVSTAITAGIAETMVLSVSGLPVGVTGSFSPASIAAGASSTLTLTVFINAVPATSTFTVKGTSASAGHTATALVTVLPTLTMVGPARVWIGLANSDAVGLRLDLLAEAFVNNVKVGQGQLDNTSAGGSGFNNAVLDLIDLGLTGGFVVVNPGDALRLRVSARRACFGGGHNSGTVRLWYNGQPIDRGVGRDAGTRFEARINISTSNYFARGGFAFDTAAGSSKLFIDQVVDSIAPCPNRPFVSFGTWSIGLP
jgi:hypothetical protein